MSIYEELDASFQEVALRTQRLIDDGWRFSQENGRITAKKGDKIVRYVDGALEQIDQMEYEAYQARLIAWYKEQGGLCPNCKIKPPINTHSCDKCGWKL